MRDKGLLSLYYFSHKVPAQKIIFCNSSLSFFKSPFNFSTQWHLLKMTPPRLKDIRQKTVHRQESRGCGDLLIWFGGSLDKRFQCPLVYCLLLPQTEGCYWLIQWSNPVSIGSHSYQTSFQSSSLYLWALGKHCFVKMLSSTLCCTVFLYNVFALTPTPTQERANFHTYLILSGLTPLFMISSSGSLRIIVWSLISTILDLSSFRTYQNNYVFM